ncbi:hypothetical protein [Streptococcus ruminantium]|nr:hypothetical protein [Streptococcus ruminantium]
MKYIKNLYSRDVILIGIFSPMSWFAVPSIIASIFSIGKEFGEALAKWF